MKTKKLKREEAIIRNENWRAKSYTEKLFDLQLRTGNSAKQKARIDKVYGGKS